MPTTVNIRKPHAYTATQLADLGGWFMGPPTHLGTGIADRWATATRDKLLEAQWRTYGRGSGAAVTWSPLRWTLNYRPEIIKPWTIAGPIKEGFRSEWVKRTPLDEFLESWKPWEAEGYRIMLHTWADPAWYATLFPPGWQKLGYPTPYATVMKDKTVMLQGALTRLWDPDYRRWMMEHLLASMRWSGADAIYLSIKHSWLAAPQVSRMTTRSYQMVDGSGFETPSTEAQYKLHGIEGLKGVFTDTPYAIDEFESGYKLLTQDLNALGIRVLTQVISHEPDIYAAFAPESGSWMGQIRVVA